MFGRFIVVIDGVVFSPKLNPHLTHIFHSLGKIKSYRYVVFWPVSDVNKYSDILYAMNPNLPVMFMRAVLSLTVILKRAAEKRKHKQEWIRTDVGESVKAMQLNN